MSRLSSAKARWYPRWPFTSWLCSCESLDRCLAPSLLSPWIAILILHQMPWYHATKVSSMFGLSPFWTNFLTLKSYCRISIQRCWAWQKLQTLNQTMVRYARNSALFIGSYLALILGMLMWQIFKFMSYLQHVRLCLGLSFQGLKVTYSWFRLLPCVRMIWQLAISTWSCTLMWNL